MDQHKGGVLISYHATSFPQTLASAGVKLYVEKKGSLGLDGAVYYGIAQGMVAGVKFGLFCGMTWPPR